MTIALDNTLWDEMFIPSDPKGIDMKKRATALLVGLAIAATALFAPMATQTAQAATTPRPIYMRLYSCPQVLEKGQYSGCITELQLALNAAGAKPQLSVDGSFGPATATAVIAFKKANGLSAANASVSDSTKKKLYDVAGKNASGKAPSKFMTRDQFINLCPTLSYGHNGVCVMQLQRLLRPEVTAAYGVSVDGIFGGGTAGALWWYQDQTRGLAADGYAGPMTKTALWNG